MQTILDKLFQNKKLSIFIPIIIAVLIYLFFIFFGIAQDKSDLIIATPVASVFWFFGLFLLVFIQVKNPMCPKWFLNLFELLAVVIFGIFSIIGTLSFFISGFKNYNVGLCLGMITYSSISFAHSKRTE